LASFGRIRDGWPGVLPRKRGNIFGKNAQRVRDDVRKDGKKKKESEKKNMLKRSSAVGVRSKKEGGRKNVLGHKEPEKNTNWEEKIG